MCISGLTHVLGAFHYFNKSLSNKIASTISVFILCTFYSLFTAIIGSLTISPYFRNLLKKYNSSNDGFVQLISALERMQKCILIFNADLRIISVSSTMTEEYFGVNNYLGLSIFDIITNSSDICKFKEAFQNLATERHSRNTISVEFKSQGNVDNVRWLESKIRRDEVKKSDGRVEIEYTMITRNIDTQKKNEILQKTLEANKLQEAVNQSKLMYITSVAHDLKAPLQTFCFGVELLRQTELSVSQQDIVTQLSVASEMMKLSISQSIDIGKSLDNRIITPRKTNISLCEIINQVKIIMSGIGASVPISYTISSLIDDNIITDREWLWQMLLNLLTNACKYTIEGSIAVTVDLINMDNDSFLIFQVADTGIGVSDSKKKTIFDAFNQAQIGQVTGTGLGMYGLRCRVEALGGICGIRDNNASSTGSGSIFWFQIPYVTYGDSYSQNGKLIRKERKDDNENDDCFDLLGEIKVNDNYDNYNNNFITFTTGVSEVGNHRHIPNQSISFAESKLNAITPKMDQFYFTDTKVSTPQFERSLFIGNTTTTTTSACENNTTRLVTIRGAETTKISTTTSTTSIPSLLRQHSSGKIMPTSSINNGMRTSISEKSIKSLSTAITTTTSSSNGYMSSLTYDLEDPNNNNNSLLSNTLTFIVPVQIYIIDDSVSILKMTKLTLGKLGFTDVECYENGYAGLVAMTRKFVDIVFTDVQMPILTGPEMAQRFREYEKKLLDSGERKQRQVIIALTANPSQDLSDLVPTIFDHICTKPISSQDLKNIIGSFCRIKEDKEDFVI